MEQTIDKKMNDASYALDMLQQSDKDGLGAEVMLFFVKFIREGQDIVDAINGALCEWDLL